ncbi:MAG TPA: UDP-N-acetylmuramate--L-alanine ligase [Vineibacter sp.]|nr:UDP-N-acetylmuramate--L-alanine ligase [Vineibacter sp.]
MKPTASLPAAIFNGAPRAHLCGIAGAGMQSLACVLLERGWNLTGSDLAPEAAAWLREAGVRVYKGHAAAHVSQATDLVIYSDAVPPTAAERKRATTLRIPELSYPAMLGRLMNDRIGMAVAGTHGKSTTTAMTAAILVEAGLDPTVVMGASPLGVEPAGRAGGGQLVLVEACEYRANFLNLAPHLVAVLGIEADHFDYFRSLDDVEAAFRQFVETVPGEGAVIANGDCPATSRVVRDLPCRVETFGQAAGCDWRATARSAKGGHYSFDLRRGEQNLGPVTLAVPGKHQVANALAAAALAAAAGVPAEAIAPALAKFRGLRRRMEVVGCWQGIVLVDDYAHHPTEISAALATVRQMYPRRRLWCVFQPHQASRTKHLLDEFAASLHNADHAAVAEIYRAREGAAAPGDVTAADLAERVRQHARLRPGVSVLPVDVLPVHDCDEILEQIAAAVMPGDVVITLGAGDIRKVTDGLAGRLGRHRAAG